MDRLRHWRHLKRYIADYSAWDNAFTNIFELHQSQVITGPPGVGKTTFLLWAIGSALEQQKHWGFKRVVFLDRTSSDDWKAACEELDPDTSLLALDSPFVDAE